MKIAVVAGKGGTGKTTISTQLAAVYASSGRLTTVVDLDPQADSTFALGGDFEKPGVVELLTGKPYDTQEVSHDLCLISGSDDVQGHAVSRLAPEGLYDAVGERENEVFIFDCPPKMEHIERLALIAADVALLAINAHPFAVKGAGGLIAEINDRIEKKRIGAKRIAIVMSQLDKRRSLDKDLPDRLREMFPDIPLFPVRTDTALSSATAMQVPITEYAPNTKAVEDLTKIKEWIDGN
jgi:chromosome partitioning protein